MPTRKKLTRRKKKANRKVRAALRTRASEGAARLGCSNPLTFAMQRQQQTQWCWAAVSISVNRFYRSASGWTQCKVVDKALGQQSCCSNGGTPRCNQPWYLDRALNIVANLRSWKAGKATFAKVQAEVNACQPLCLRIGWNGGGGHFVAVYGYSGSSLNVADPWYGNSVQSYSTFPGSYNGGGAWTHDYYTKP